MVPLFGLDLSGSGAAVLGGLAVVLASLGYAVGGFIVKRSLPDARDRRGRGRHERERRACSPGWLFWPAPASGAVAAPAGGARGPSPAAARRSDGAAR